MEGSFEVSGGAGAMSPIILLLDIAIVVLMIASVWKIFTKAGQPGWASIIPFYNIYVELQVVGRPAWWLVLFFVPVANLVVAIIITFELAKVFGKSTGYGVGLPLLPFVFYPMLAFGQAQYTAPAPAA